VNANFGLAAAYGTILIALTFIPLAILFRVMGKREEVLV
jgi:ABC-type sugar transport system permease subunit